MRNLKKILALVLAMVMVLSVMVTASAAEYADADSIKYTQAVEVMSELAILQGDGTNFNPKGELTRAEAAVILTKILMSSDLKSLAKLADAIDNPFTDVADSHWGVDYIKYCYNEGLIIGNGNGSFYPTQKLTGYAFAKTLLIAAGIGDSDDYLTDKTGSWESKVLAAANKNKLLTGLSTLKLSANITREEAAQMALNAMKAGATVTVTYEIETANGITFETSDALVAATWDGKDGVTVTAIEEVYGGLLYENFDVYCRSGVDTFGRPATVYTYDWSYRAYGLSTDAYYPSAAVATYTTATKAATVLADLGGYYIEDNAGNTYIVADDTAAIWDVTVVDATASSDVLNAEAGMSFAQIAALTGYNKVVEVYADAYGYIVKVVVVETRIGTVATITPANELYGVPEMFTMGDTSGNVNTAGLKKNVAYTYNVTTGNKAVNVAPAVGFEGTLTAYNNYGSMVIDGKTYVAEQSIVDYAAANYFNQKTTYYVGANGSILAVGTPANVVVGNYAVVVAGAVKTDVETNLWETATSATVQVKAVLSNGTYGVYNIPVYTAVDGSLYILVSGERVAIDSINVTGTLTEDLNGVYTYTLDGNNISLGANFGTAVVAADHTAIAKGALSVTVDTDVTALINSDTVFVLDADGDLTTTKYTTVKGSAGIAGIAQDDAVVIYKPVYNVKGELTHYVVTNVIAIEDTPAAVGVSGYDLNNYVYVTTLYNTVVDAELGEYYIYVAYKMDGSIETVLSTSLLYSGVYTYDATTKLPVAWVDMTWGVITAVAGTTYEVATTTDFVTFVPGYFVITDSATVLDLTTVAEFEVGDTVAIKDIDADGKIDLVIIAAAAE